MGIHSLAYKDLTHLSKSYRFSLLMTHDPKIHKDVWEKSDMIDLVHWTFHQSLFDKTIDKIAANIAKRLRARTIKRQIAFLKKHNYLSEYNLFLAVKIIRGLMKSPVKNFPIVTQLEQKFFATNEQRILLWKNVFDGLPNNCFEKRVAFYKLLKLIPFKFATSIVFDLKMVKKSKNLYSKLPLAA